ncbi:MAG: PrsW family intramembrane metalloprotease [Thermoplasmatota archaeon]
MALRELGLILVLSLLPPLLFAIGVRNRENFQREPLRIVFRAFLYGGTIGAGAAFILNTLFGTAAARYLDVPIESILLTAVVAAPLFEELVKATGLPTAKKWIREWEDGIVYGAAVGLGFAATENVLYGVTALLDDGTSAAVSTVILRTVTSTILHAATSSLVGFAYSLAFLRDRPVVEILPAYLLAVFIHAVYNFTAIRSTLLMFALSAGVVWMIFLYMQKQITRLDALPHGRWHRDGYE